MNKMFTGSILYLFLAASLVFVSCSRILKKEEKVKSFELPHNSASLLLMQKDSFFLRNAEYGTKNNLDLAKGYGNLKLSLDIDSLYLEDWKLEKYSNDIKGFVKEIRDNNLLHQSTVFTLYFYRNKLISINFHFIDTFEMNQQAIHFQEDSFTYKLYVLYGDYDDSKLLKSYEEKFVWNMEELLEDDPLKKKDIIESLLETFKVFSRKGSIQEDNEEIDLVELIKLNNKKSSKTTKTQLKKARSVRNIPSYTFEKYNYSNLIFKWESDEIGFIVRGRNQYNIRTDEFDPYYKYEKTIINGMIYEEKNFNTFLSELGEILNSENIKLQKIIDSVKRKRNQEKLDEILK